MNIGFGFRGGRRPSLALGGGIASFLHAGIIGLAAWWMQASVVAAELDENVAVVPLDAQEMPAVAAPPAATLTGAGDPTVAPPARQPGRRRRRIGMALALPRAATTLAVPVEVARRAPERQSLPAPSSLPARGPIHLASSEARDLRFEDEFPPLPAPLRVAGARHLAQLQICVSAAGAVSALTVAPGVAPPLVTVLTAAVRRWRYRAYMIGGVAVPFCHTMSVAYSM
jgi:hypothetical protein